MGTWTTAEADEMDAALADFETIDESAGCGFFNSNAYSPLTLHMAQRAPDRPIGDRKAEQREGMSEGFTSCT